jgi:hypothetical protein
LRDRHDELVARSGTFDKAIAAIKQYKEAGFRVCTNTTIFLGTSAGDVRVNTDYLTAVGVDAMTVSPGYAVSSARLRGGDRRCRPPCPLDFKSG